MVMMTSTGLIVSLAEPTIFTDVNPDAKIVKEEIFGPVVVVTKFKDDNDIIKVANNSVYGLAAAVFSRDISRAMNLANKLQAGSECDLASNTL